MTVLGPGYHFAAMTFRALADYFHGNDGGGAGMTGSGARCQVGANDGIAHWRTISWEGLRLPEKLHCKYFSESSMSTNLTVPSPPRHLHHPLRP